MTQYIEKDRNTAIPIVLGILKYWPWTTTSKQLLLFNELEDIMELISPSVLERVVRVLPTCLPARLPAFVRLRGSFSSVHPTASVRPSSLGGMAVG